MANQYAPSFMQGKAVTQEEALAARSGDKLQDRLNMNNKRASFNDTGKYSVSNLMYPEDLISMSANEKYPRNGGTEYGNNYVVFYINVNESSKLLKDQNPYTGNKIVSDWSETEKTRLAGQNVSENTAATGSAVEGAIAGGVVKGDVTGAAAGAGLNIAGTKVIGTQVPNFTRQMKRLASAIALHTPNQHTARYSANWEDQSTAAFQLAMRGGEGLVKAVAEGFNKQAISNENMQLAKDIGATMALNTIGGKDAISAITGLATNPKKEQIFKGVDFRTWSFEYQFFPKSRQEMENVQNIIYMFKLHMHPEYKDANNFLYIYPSEFDIVHYNGTTENLNLPKHTSCVLTELVVNYAPQSQFTSFENGAPTQINIQMTFKELTQMSKERIMEGF